MQKSKLSAKPIRAVNSAGGTLLIFSMKGTLTVMLSPRFDLAPATRQTQHQIMYQELFPLDGCRLLTTDDSFLWSSKLKPDAMTSTLPPGGVA